MSHLLKFWLLLAVAFPASAAQNSNSVSTNILAHLPDEQRLAGTNSLRSVQSLAYPDGKSAVFAITKDFEVCCNAQTESGWTGWRTLGGVTGFTQVAPILYSNGRLACCALGNGLVWFNAQTADHQWRGWKPLPDISGASHLSVTLRADESLEIHAAGCAPSMFYDFDDGVTSIYSWGSAGGSFSLKQKADVSGNYFLSQVGPRVAAADVDGDGIMDNVVAYQNTDGTMRLHVFDRGNAFRGATGWFQSGPFNLTNVAGRMAGGDFNGDGKGDVALLYDNGAGSMTIHRFLSTGSSFVPETARLPSGYNLSNVGDNVAAGDVNGDGKTDLVTAYQYSDGTMRLHVFLNGNSFTGSNGWYQSGLFNLAKAAGRMVGGDFNGDGKDDVALVYDDGSDSMTIHRFLSTGTAFTHDSFNIPSGYSLANVGDNVVAGDVDGDGQADIVMANKYEDNTMRLHVFPGGNSYTGPYGWYQSGAFTMSKVAGRMTMIGFRTVRKVIISLEPNAAGRMGNTGDSPLVTGKARKLSRAAPNANSLPVPPVLPTNSINAGRHLASYRSRFFAPGEDTLRNTVQAIAQTPDGFLWIGTQDGLARFDGERFDFFPMGRDQSQAQRINALAVDHHGSLWVGTAAGLFQRKEGQWISHAMPVQASENILSLRCSPDGFVFIGTQTELLCYADEMLLLIGDVSQRKTSGAFSIRAISEPNSADLWAAAGSALVRLRDGCRIAQPGFDAFKPAFLHAVCRRRDGSIWVGSNSGLIQIKEVGNHRDPNQQPSKAVETTYSHFTKANGLPNNTVTTLYEDHRGNLWVGTYGGLCRFADGKFTVELTPEGDPYNQIFCFLEDREDNLWVGSKEGLHQLRVQPFSTLTIRQGLAHNSVISVYEDGQTNLWIGTWGGGLHRLRDGKITVYSTASHPKMRNDLVLAIEGSRNGGIWFGTDYEGGLHRMKDGELQSYGRKEGLGRGAIRALLEDQSGRLWIGLSASYLNVLEHGKITAYKKQHGLPTSSNRCLLQTRDGHIWLGTGAGLCCWTNGGFSTFTTSNGLPDDEIFSLYEDKEGSLWIGTGKGLCQLRRQESGAGDEAGGKNSVQNSVFSNDTPPSPSVTNHALPITSYPGFFDDAILEILEDDFENFWLATRRGVVRVSRQELAAFDVDQKYKVNFTLFGKDDGMASSICVGVVKPSAFKGKDGRLWFATTKGLAVTDPALKIEKNEKPPPVVIRAVLADKQKILDTGSRNQKTKNETTHFPASPLSVAPGRGELEFHYTALSYTAPEKNRFKYKLEGLDSDWVDAGTRQTAFYNRVPPGDYTFRVIACNNDGVWNPLGANVNLSLQPHYWQTWWFNTFVILASLSFVGTGVRYVTGKRMQFRLERLEHQHAIEKERTRIARDMHDDLGARLSEILLMSSCAIRHKTIPSEVKTHVEQISQSAREVIDNLDGIVWAVDPKNDSLDVLAPYLYEYVESYLKLTDIRCRLDVPSQMPRCSLSSEVHHHLFMVVKESLHNIAKYSEATEVCFRLQVESSTLFVSIEDNGKGFSVAEAASSGNGLQNMEKRMKSVGGAFVLTSDLGSGTSVRIQIPLQITLL